MVDPAGSRPSTPPSAPSAPPASGGGPGGGNPMGMATGLLSSQTQKSDQLLASELSNTEDGTKRMLDNTTTSAGEASKNAQGVVGGDGRARTGAA